MVQYLDWASGVARGDLGNSLVPPEQPVWDIIGPALRNSLKLAVFAFVLVVPFGILGGVLSGLRVGKATDRGITVVGLSLAVVPEFVTGLVLILVFSIWAGWLPVTAQWEPGSGPLTQVKHLTLPAIALTLVLFGYVARITRAGVVEALDSDYTRTAFLKGLPRKTVIRRHVLRNAILPTIAVIATQVGYLLGGLVAIELLFNYRGIGLTTLEAAQAEGLHRACSRCADHRIHASWSSPSSRTSSRRSSIHASASRRPSELGGGADGPLGSERRAAGAATPARQEPELHRGRDGHPLLGRVRDPR